MTEMKHHVKLSVLVYQWAVRKKNTIAPWLAIPKRVLFCILVWRENVVDMQSRTPTSV